jgi:hypothetical protein
VSFWLRGIKLDWEAPELVTVLSDAEQTHDLCEWRITGIVPSLEHQTLEALEMWPAGRWLCILSSSEPKAITSKDQDTCRVRCLSD